MDRLSRILEATHLQGSLIGMIQLSAPWHIDHEQWVGAPTHYIVEGEAVLEHEGAAPQLLSAGDLVMFPQWQKHQLRSPGAAGPPVSIREIVENNNGPPWRPGEWLEEPLIMKAGGGGARTVILSMVFSLDTAKLHPMFAAMPRLVHLSSRDIDLGPWLPSLLQFMEMEKARHEPGYAAISSRIADLIFLQILRAQALRSPGAGGFARALSDPAIGALLQALHEAPGASWTLASMARRAGLSRSTFSARFREMMDVTPAAYLRGLRLDTAAERLRMGTSVKQAFEESGYTTLYAFSTAFAARFGTTPARFRTGPNNDRFASAGTRRPHAL